MPAVSIEPYMSPVALSIGLTNHRNISLRFMVLLGFCVYISGYLRKDAAEERKGTFPAISSGFHGVLYGTLFVVETYITFGSPSIIVL
ncbi:uncharacterized protein EV420DRAFT_1530531 [Desarmillaria tabescens]|uniref:Uncharacterized protein n=1 Tax=Armillaria tabescens TaxID=1929756 RepID=A0AA39N8U2_ARMTA|nr:uncharacterized protein EV420DRAFT_1530531 [Desarmillaria tabescens]KAK0461139.1 hypothetical protein EV420DRAFT_1530531 [Desarmillaria tabescens]